MKQYEQAILLFSVVCFVFFHEVMTFPSSLKHKLFFSPLFKLTSWLDLMECNPFLDKKSYSSSYLHGFSNNLYPHPFPFI